MKAKMNVAIKPSVDKCERKQIKCENMAGRRHDSLFLLILGSKMTLFLIRFRLVVIEYFRYFFEAMLIPTFFNLKKLRK